MEESQLIKATMEWSGGLDILHDYYLDHGEYLKAESCLYPPDDRGFSDGHGYEHGGGYGDGYGYGHGGGDGHGYGHGHGGGYGDGYGHGDGDGYGHGDGDGYGDGYGYGG